MFSNKYENMWRWLVLGYALVWLWGCLIIFSQSPEISDELVLSSYWSLALRFGIVGGAMAIFRGLYFHWTTNKHFKSYRAVAYYLVQPIIGGIAGLLVFVIVYLASASSILKIDEIEAFSVTTMLILLSWLIGFEQNRFGWVSKMINRLPPTETNGD